MNTKLTPNAALMERFVKFLDETMGLHIRKESWPLFEKKFQPAVEDFGFEDTAACIEWLINTPINEDQIAILAHHLTVGETYFFRDSNAFQTLEHTIIPSIIESKSGGDKKIRIWSAASCTGEEAYSVAMLLKMMIPNIHEWQITILASDINASFLHLAKEGKFRDWSFRATPKSIKDRFFQKTKDGKYQIDQSIKDMVQFRYLNLVDDTYPSLLNETNAMDLILCNNVLIYFSESTINNVVKKLCKALVQNGWLIVSPVEAPYVNDPSLITFDSAHTSAFHKSSIVPEKPKKTVSPIIDVVLPEFTQPSQPVLKFDFTEAAPATKPAKEEKRVLNAVVNDYENALHLYEKGEYQQVIALVESKPMNLNSLILLSKSYGNIGSLDKALECCEKAITFNKLDPFLYYLKASILQEQNQNDLAVEAFKKALFVDSGFIIAHFMLANLIKEKDPSMAKRHYRNALALLESCGEDDLVPNSEGLTAGRLREFINTMQGGLLKHG